MSNKFGTGDILDVTESRRLGPIKNSGVVKVGHVEAKDSRRCRRTPLVTNKEAREKSKCRI